MRIKSRFLLLLAGIYFLSCQKELQYDLDVKSVGILSKDAGGNCLPSAVSGIYVIESPLDTSHYIDVQVDISVAGSYQLVTDTVNGIYFRDNAAFSSTGINMVRLKGFGKPVNEGSFSFVVHYDNSSTCSATVVVSPAGGGPLASFSLAGAPGACITPEIQGNYSPGVPLDITNKIILTVNVDSTGNYALAIPMVNGISFKATGVFTTTGSQKVVLSGSGIPIIANTTNLTVSGSGSGCSFPLTIGQPTENETAIYAIAGGFGDCSAGSSFIGKFVAGSPLSANEFMNIEAFVSLLGTYTITTDTVNGVYFHAAGTFTTGGSQTVKLNGFGNPVTTGSFNFQLKAGVSDCTSYKSFFGDGAIASPGDYFPTGTSSWWSYNSNTTNPDTLYKKSEGSETIGSVNYTKFYIGKQPAVLPYGNSHFRRNVGDVYERIKVDTFMGSQFNAVMYDDLLFLRQDAPAGTAWESQLFSGSNQLGQSLKIKYRFQIEAVGSTLIVNGKTYNDVTRVVWGGYANSNNFGGYEQQFAAESFYAKGIGLIKFQSYPGYPNASWGSSDELRNYQVF